MKKTLPAEQRKWIVEFERTTGTVIHGEKWTKFLMDETSWDEFMSQCLSDYADSVQNDMNYLANLYHSLEMQADETDRV